MLLHSLVLSGGAMKALAFVGCIRYLEHVGMRDSIRCFVGCSAGALLSLMLVVGMTVEDIENWALPELRSRHIDRVDIADGLWGVYDRMALDSGNRIQAFASDILARAGFERDATFIRLAKATGKDLVVCAADILASEPCHFRVDTHPDVQVAVAVRASASVPLLFSPVMIRDRMYVDGGIFHNLPVDALHGPYLAPGKTLAINVCPQSYFADAIPTNIVEFITLLTTSMIRRANSVRVRPVSTVDVVVVDLSVPGPFINVRDDHLTFDIDVESQNARMDAGYDAVEKALAPWVFLKHGGGNAADDERTSSTHELQSPPPDVDATKPRLHFGGPPSGRKPRNVGNLRATASKSDHGRVASSSRK